jgi:uncharacterized membrane protein
MHPVDPLAVSAGRKNDVSWNRWYTLKSHLLSALWLAPLIAFVAAQTTFRVPIALGLDFAPVAGFAFTPEGKVSAMDIDITLNLSYIVFAFSSLLVAIQVSSAQLTPRIIATTLLRNNVIRWTVGLFTYGLLIAIGARNRLDTVPDFVVSLAAIWGLLSTVAFLFLIDYAARLLRPVSIVWRVGREGIKVIESVYPHSVEEPRAPRPQRLELGRPARIVDHHGTSGVVLAVNMEALIAEAQRADGIIEFVPRIGDFVARGEPLFRLHGGAAAISDRKLRGQVAFGPERTIEQDSTFALRVVVDIALKALSKAINDPTTAVVAIDQIQRLLHAAGRRHLHNDTVFDATGRLRVILRTPDWEDFVQLAHSEIRQYGAESLQVARRLRAMSETLVNALPENRHAALRRELDLLDRQIEKLYVLPEDLALARVADSQGLGGALRSKPDTSG